ncbi:MAG TPA: methionyl-tRNA formyltransferase [Ignavibacteria bacterium]|nr:methionyl-tRNA formyltransferase [Ignavibacteria bacterium]
MRIIFMGTPEFAVPSLSAIFKSEHDLISVVTIPDRKKGRGQNVSFSEVKKFAMAKRIDFLQPDDISNEDFLEKLISLKPDLIVVVAFKILPEIIFDIPTFGIFNLHASLLPKYRGAAPINRAIMNGEPETGVTTFFLEKKVDTGNVILQQKIPILPDDNAGSLHDKLSELGAEVVMKTIDLIDKSDKNIPPVIKQDDSLSSKAPKIFKEDCLLSWDDLSVKIHNKIRGLSPYPAAYTRMIDKNIKILKSRLTEMRSESEPGVISISDNKLLVSTKDNLLEILELQPEGKNKMSARDFINGLKIK